MKKILTLLSALFCLSSMFSQFQYGAKAGLNYNVVSVNIKQGSTTDVDNPSGIGFHVGGYFGYALNEKLSVRPELLFSSCRTHEKSESSMTSQSFDIDTGASINITTTTEEEDKSSFNYLEIPVLADYSISENISIQAGPSIGLLMGYKNEASYVETIKYSNGDPTETSSYSGTSTSKVGLNSLNLGVALGGIYQMDSGLNFGLRYQRGLSSINSIYTDFITQKWNIIQLSVGYKLSK